MPYKEHMTWRENGCRWVKKYRGKQYVVSCRQLNAPPTKQASRDAANEWWQKKRADIAAQPPEEELDRQYALALDYNIKMLEWFKTEGDNDAIAWMKNEIKNLRELAAEGKPFRHSLNQIHNMPPVGRAVWKERFRILRSRSTTIATDRTIKAQVKRFLELKQAQVSGKQRSVGRWAAIKAHLGFFSEWIGQDQSVDAITSLKLTDFYSYLMNSANFTPIYKRDILVTTKTFIQFCFEHDLIALPKNLRSTNLSIRKGKQRIRTIEVSQLRTLINSATDRTKLYLLLMANTGMQQKDISDLTNGHVKWLYKGKHLQEAWITRKRSKTQHHGNVPEVTYKLWPETARLLEMCRNRYSADEDGWLLVTAEGKPLIQEEIRDGEVSRSDNIKSAYVRLLRKLNIFKDKASRKTLQLKLIRKTSASMLEKHPVFGRYANHFLADSPRSIADTHYIVPDQKNFDDALHWLREQILVVPMDEDARRAQAKRHRAKSEA